MSKIIKTSRLIVASGCFVVALLVFSPLALADPPNTWVAKAPMPTARNGLGVASVNNIVYAIGGDVDFYGCGMTGANEAYDPSTNTWATMAPMPTPRTMPSVAVLNGIIYVVGGSEGCYPPSTVVEAYDPSTNTWTTKAPFPAGPGGYGVTSGSGIGVINGLLYVAGGNYTVSASPFSALLYAYDPVANSWSTRASMPDVRAATTGAVVNGLLYVVGGTNLTVNATSTFAYDPTLDTWFTKASLLVPRGWLATTVVSDKIYAIGGSNAGSSLGSMEAYAPGTDTWMTLPSMPTPRSSLGAAQVNGTIYAMGGLISGATPTSSVVEAYTPASVHVQPPIKSDGSSVFRTSRRVIQVEFTLSVGGEETTCNLPPATITLTRTAGGVLGTISLSEYVLPTDNGSNFRIFRCEYVYDLGSKTLGPGTYRVDVTLSGAGVAGSAVFSLRKHRPGEDRGEDQGDD